ncbi:hypothetical protein [Bradyrhizobium manausense]|uniref:Uncharacterized protein n=1 Tax=Bradyrhizobium manausense TaxID=989370 RepID=A0A0R3EBP4_9BRAD|nr:hypothetical protein [Bradyrhizobium manausense]KRQ16719.1 hypothetical protein AOQ71_04595 [Bradyrhizobium manausense]
MAGEAWVVLGTAVGTAGTLLSTWLTAHLKKNEDEAYDGSAMSLLRAQLELQKWTEIDMLANLIGLDEDDTRQYLILLKARGVLGRKAVRSGDCSHVIL